LHWTNVESQRILTTLSHHYSDPQHCSYSKHSRCCTILWVRRGSIFV